MRLFKPLLAIASISLSHAASISLHTSGEVSQHRKISPKIFIISMFTPEATIWHSIPDFNLLAHNISLAGLSPLFPSIHCTPTYEICQIVTGEGEINAAVTISALLFSNHFNLTRSHFLIAGIAGISPEHGTTGSVTFPRFAVQPALQHEIDIRELPGNFSTGYIPQGSTRPGVFPKTVYGTEVFELDARLVDVAAGFARNASLADSDAARQYRRNYLTADNRYHAATQPPGIVQCDTSTSDVYFAGHILTSTFANTTKALTGGKGVYCTSQQEDNATLEALIRGAKAGLLDFRRIIIMRSGSDFDRPFPGQTALQGLLYSDHGGFEIAVRNLYLAGREVIKGILGSWGMLFQHGFDEEGYAGDVWGSLSGGVPPDFGAAMDDGGEGVIAKRGVQRG
ncbi:purine nucleoside permease [Aspergillus pseudodeflectus]|uniref:Purine nucleoside permease n=1 Tax=Aspergillus pseudodeflectus TaxID=176178 RepID=A0ABR4JNZ3_9EURO